MKQKKIRFFVASPDGFPIERERTHSTPEGAWESFDEWKKRFEIQGYYSTIQNSQRVKIPLNELRLSCELKSVNL